MPSEQLSYIPRSSKYQRLKALLSKDWAMLLDSGIKNQQTAQKANSYRRYDICVCAPSVQLTVVQKSTRILRKQKQAENSSKDPLILMREILDEYAPEESSVDDSIPALPFNGGWLGYISYDFGQLLQHKALKKLASQETIDDLKVPLIRMGLYQWAIISDHKNKTSIMYNFGLPKDQWEQLKLEVIPLLATPELTNPDALSESLISTDTAIEKPSLIAPFESNLNYNGYAKSFQKIQDYILAGDCYQVNFAQRFTANFTGCSFDFYTILAKENNSPFSAYLNFSDQQILSLSPERFIESHQGEIITQPIKGTLPRDTDPEKDKMLAEKLAHSEKDKAENLMIVDLLRNDLSKTAAKGSVKVTELFGLYHFESVHHLISTVKSTLDKKYDNFDLLATTLPGGSITGAPKIRAMQIIDELESVPRGIYCGVIGYIDFKGNMDTNICIRTLIADKNTLYCWAGGGLVADSKLDSEYQETFDKLNKILPVLNNTINKQTRADE